MKHIITGVFCLIAIAFAVAARNVIVLNREINGASVAEASANTQPSSHADSEQSADAAPLAQNVSPIDGTQVAATEPGLATPSDVMPASNNGSPNPYRIQINIPAFRLRLFENDKVIKVYPICAGMPGHRSPISKMAISMAIWNPSWGPPPEADWAAHSAAKGPGPFNPVGLVKMPLRGYVFIHGTYKIKSLGFAWSHGCMRMANEDAVELAWFLQSHVGNNHPEHTLDTYRQSRRTTPVKFNSSVPVETVYQTVEVYDDRVMIHPDVYRMGGNSVDRVVSMLGEAGWPTTSLNYDAIGKLINRSKVETAIGLKKDIVSK